MHSRMANGTPHPTTISCASVDSIGSMKAASSANRARFLIASTTDSMNLPPSQQNHSQFGQQHEREYSPFWTCARDIGRKVHSNSRLLISTYLPVAWHGGVLRVVDLLYDWLDWNIFTKSSVRDESGLVRVKSFFVRSLLIGLVILLVLLMYSLIATLILKLALPFYAQFSLVYWLLLTCKDWSNYKDLSHQQLSGNWCLSAVLTELSALLINYLITGENSNNCNNWFDQLSYYAVPLAAVAVAKFHTDHSGVWSTSLRKMSTSQSAGLDKNRYGLILCYVAITYAVRYFAIQGFTLLPLVLRPFLGYAACFLAIWFVERTTYNSPSSQKCNGQTCDARCCSQANGGTTGSHATLNNASPVHAKFNNSTKFHLLPDGDFFRLATAAGRNSRRVSLPAGSLVPVMAQSNISEARGLIADMLAQKDLPPQLVTGLRAVSTLLLPALQSNHFLSSSHFDLPRVLGTPYMGMGVESVGQRRQSPIVVTWSTTTSATGLPTVEPEPSRARSSCYWKQKQMEDGANQSPKSSVTPQQSSELSSTLIQVADGTFYSLTDMDKDTRLAQIQDWSLPIFDLYSDNPDTVLSRMAYAIFKRADLFRIFKISKQKFFSFFHALEKGYWEMPYHNRIHAADVMHATYYLTSNKVPIFSNSAAGAAGRRRRSQISKSLEDGNEKFTEENVNGVSKLSSVSCILENCVDGHDVEKDGKSGTLASVLSSLEVMALYTASAMHDYDHPGRTNAFLVAIEDKKAILYNDRSVLENHHAAASWQLLNQAENNFIEHLDSAEFKRFRYMIIEAILATDLKRHFEILMDFNTKVSNCGLDWENESDKLLTCQVCIKMADINSPTKPFSLHKEWTNRIVEEFYAQGDEERYRGLPVSPYMDRHEAQLATLQDSFITHLVAPLAQGMDDAGLLPVINSSSTECTDSNSPARSELLINLEHNQNYWKSQLGESTDEQLTSSASQSTPNLIVMTKQEENNENSATGQEMMPIQEQDENGSGESSSPTEKHQVSFY